MEILFGLVVIFVMVVVLGSIVWTILEAIYRFFFGKSKKSQVQLPAPSVNRPRQPVQRPRQPAPMRRSPSSRQPTQLGSDEIIYIVYEEYYY